MLLLVWTFPQAYPMYYDEGEATTLGRLIAEQLHNTFYMTNIVDYTVINDYKTHHHDNLKQLDCCLVQIRSLYVI